MKLGLKEKSATLVKGSEDDVAEALNGAGLGTDLDFDALGTANVCLPPAWSRSGHCWGNGGLVSEEDVAQALIVQEETGKRLGETLVEMGVLNERELILVLADLLHMPVVDLRHDNPEPEALALIPEQVVREHMAMPIRLDDDGLQVAVSDQPSVAVRALFRRRRDHPIRFVLSPESDIQWAIDSSYRAIGGVDTLVEAFEAVEDSRKRTNDRHRSRGRRRRRAHCAGGHPDPDPGQARPGIRRPHRAVPGRRAGAVPHRRCSQGGPDAPRRHGRRTGQPDQDHGGHEHRRTASPPGRSADRPRSTARTPTSGWPPQPPSGARSACMRILDKNRSVLRLHDLGMPNDTHETFSRLVRAPFGMVLCAGPTGSGKTTTLYATLGEVSDPTQNVMTIEDPVEYVFPSINQIQTNEQAGLTFATGLKSILRQDPDVILVGEIRDVETARIAVQSALTGHLVLSSLHATDSVSALHRFLDMGIESFLIASSVHRRSSGSDSSAGSARHARRRTRRHKRR